MESQYGAKSSPSSSKEQMKKITNISSLIPIPTAFLVESFESLHFWVHHKGQEWQCMYKNLSYTLEDMTSKACEQIRYQVVRYDRGKKKKRTVPTFLTCSQMAELRRNQRGEIGRQNVKAHSCCHFSPCFDHTSPTQTDDGTSQIDHDIGAYAPYSFRTMSRVLLRPPPTEVQG